MLYYIILVAAMVGADQLIKHWAESALKGQAAIEIIHGFFRLRYVENDGAAFSMLKGKQTFLILVTVAAFGLLFYMIKEGMITGKLGYHAVAFVMGGGIGNLLDRLRMGYVIDMFDWCWIDFPVFNMADLCVTAGAVLFILMLYGQYKQERREKEK